MSAQVSPSRGRSESARRARRPPSARRTIVPVRVCNAHGDYFDTEIDQQRPLRALQQAIEDYFHVKSELQLITHNRQQVDPELSLYNNGCVLLKGDPYIKLVFTVKRGLLLNLVCQLSAEEAVPLAAHEMGTVYAVKQQLCEELVRRLQREEAEAEAERGERAAQHSPSTNHTSPTRQRSRSRGYAAYCAQPQRVRLLWRYMELNDKATLHYYHIPTNAVLHVRWRRGPLPSSAAAAGHLPHELSSRSRVVWPRSASRHDDRRFLALQPLIYDVREGNTGNGGGGPRPATAAAPVQPPREQQHNRQAAAAEREEEEEEEVESARDGAWQGYVPVAGYGAMPMPYDSHERDAAREQHDAVHTPFSQPAPPPAAAALHSALRPTSSPHSAAAAVRYTDDGHAMAPASSASTTSQQHNHYNNYYRPATSPLSTPAVAQPLPMPSSAVDVQGRAEVLALREAVRVLQTQIDALRLQQAREQGRSEVQTSVRSEHTVRTAQRIEELEATVERFHGFLQRALSLLG